jgi:hypothetical protein
MERAKRMLQNTMRHSSSQVTWTLPNLLPTMKRCLSPTGNQEEQPPAKIMNIALEAAENTPVAPRNSLLIKRLSEKAKLPTRGSALAAGYDLYRYVATIGVIVVILYRLPYFECYLSAEKKVIPAKGKALVDTQISIAVPVGTYGRVAPRSGLGKQYIQAICLTP